MSARLVTDAQLQLLSVQVGEVLLLQKQRLVCAESCTGGWVAKSLTDVEGCSRWFDCGFVTYTNLAKQNMLGVEAALLERYGAVSKEVVRAMVNGALRHSQASVALSISGIAGPGGGTKDKPVGLVCFAWAHAREAGQLEQCSRQQVFAGEREAVRRQAVAYSLQGVLELLDGRG